MQRPVKVSEAQLLALAAKSHNDYSMTGVLSKRSADCTKWRLRTYTIYQNMLLYFDDGGKLVGVIFLEGSYCEPVGSGASVGKGREMCDRQHCFIVKFRREDLRHYVFQAETESTCHSWIDAIQQASFNKQLLMKEELEQKHLHLLHIVESEKTARWQYTQQCEELTVEIKKLRAELCALKKELRLVPGGRNTRPEESDEIRKIKKVQSFFRGWLCRRRWQHIVEEYIRSPHAENMRKRNR